MGNHTEWTDVQHNGDRTLTRAVGDFLLTVDASPDGWRWWATWGDNDIAEGETKLTRADNDDADAWEHALPRAIEECEAAARKAGIAVPLASSREPMTVGAALALPEVQRGEAVVEHVADSGASFQVDIKANGLRCRAWRKRVSAWRRWESGEGMPLRAEDYALPCRLVPLAAADADPSTRGDL